MQPPRTHAEEFIIAGHSHIFAMGAPQSYSGPLQLAPVDVRGNRGYFLMEEWQGDRSGAYWERLYAEAPGRRIFVAFNGNQHMARFLIPPDPLIDVFDPEWPYEAAHPGATMVPRSLIKDYFGSTVQLLEKIANNLLQTNCASITILGTPPPRANVEEFRQLIQRAPFFKKLAADRGIDLSERELPIIPPLILRKLWGIVQEMMSDIAARTGVRFLPVPPGVRDSRGFLLPRYCGDVTHGSPEYGKLMLEYAVSN